MERWPRISIVTPSFNQGQYIGETIESVIAQDYPDVEHIVIDGGSTDGTLEILARHPHLRVISEPDRGHADAINKGLRLATGEIVSFLNSDDTLAPGALRRVGREIDPSSARHVVMGRCRFIDEHGRYTGIEHPSDFRSHRRVLKVWKGHTIPQPAVFWTADVWRTCGPMDESVRSAWIDYDLFCRISRRYRFHVIDRVLANYRLHADSKTSRSTAAGRLQEAICLSRRHWGSPLRPGYWQLASSLAIHRLRTEPARRLLRRARDRWRERRRRDALFSAVGGILLAPEIAFHVAVYPALKAQAKNALTIVLLRAAKLFTYALLRNPSAIRATAFCWRIAHQPFRRRSLSAALHDAKAWLRSSEGKNFMYDLQTIAVMSRVLKPTSSGVDVGAFDGHLLARMVTYAPSGRHYAVEPLPEKAAELEIRFPQVCVLRVALSDANGQTDFQHVVTNPAYSGLRRRRYDRPGESVRSINVETRRLDDIIPPDLRVRFMKVDVEGAELQVFLGARQTITQQKPFIVFEHGPGAADYYGTRPEHVYDFLVGDCGMHVSLMSRWLRGGAPLERPEFIARFDAARDFYFLAHP
jgi:FkbM family methyltransferase